MHVTIQGLVCMTNAVSTQGFAVGVNPLHMDSTFYMFFFMREYMQKWRWVVPTTHLSSFMSLCLFVLLLVPGI